MKRTLLLSLVTLMLGNFSSAQWSTYHGSSKRDGRTLIVGPTNPVQQWIVDVGGAIASSPVVGTDGTIYVGATWDMSVPKPAIRLNAIRPDGTFKWRLSFPFSDIQTISTPCLDSDDNIYFGDGNGTLRSVDSNGTLRWTFQGTKPIHTHMLVAGGDTLYAQIDGKLYNFVASTGAIRWSFDLGINYEGGPTLDDLGNVYVVTSAGVTSLTQLGVVRWTSVTPGGSCPVAIGPDGSVVVAGYWIVKLNSTNGSILWQIGGGNTINTIVTPTIDDQNNVIYAETWEVIKRSSTGAFLWSYEIRQSNFLGYPNSSAILDGANRLYLTLGWYARAALAVEKNVICLNATTGALIWSRPLGSIGSPSAPAIAKDGTLYVGCMDGKLYAFR